MYKSDKVATEHAFFPFLLGVVAIESISSQNNDYAIAAKEAFKKACDGKETKIVKRCHALSAQAVLPIRDASSNKISGHKFVIFLYALAQKILDSGYLLPEYTVAAFDKFLTLEQEIEIEEDEWLKLKASAGKAANKVYDNLLKLNYFTI